MIKKFFLNKLTKLILFYNSRLKIKSQALSPPDLYYAEVSKNSYEYFKKYFKDSYIYSEDESIRRFAINEAIKKFNNKDLFLEFGVFKGDSINLFAESLNKINAEIYGFDAFKGLKEEWVTEEYNPTGTFDLKGVKPKVKNNVQLVDGWVEDTYESTSYVLKLIKNKFQSGTIILFDEFYGFPNWEKYEYKAFKEEIEENSFKYIAFGTRQACIQII